jgi:molecular chaperone GrpE
MSKKKDQDEVSEGAQNASGAPGQVNSKDGSANSAPAGGEPGKAAADGPCASAEDRITALEAEIGDLKDKLLRKQADFENFRKRTIREREESSRYANAALLTDIIGLIDDFERAIRSAEESRDFPGFLQGVSMIEKQLVEMLENRWGLKRFSSLGEGFDPNKHEAVLREEGPADSKPTVVEDYQKGYYLHERVLRPARVKVMVPGSGPAPAEPPALRHQTPGGKGASAAPPASEKPEDRPKPPGAAGDGHDETARTGN